MNIKKITPILFALVGLPIFGHGALIITPTILQDESNSVYTVSNTDLLQTNLGSVTNTGSVYNEFSGGLAALYDGQFGFAGTAGQDTGVTDENGDPVWVSPGQQSFGLSSPGGSITFNLDLSSNAAGYTIFSISTYTGWDPGRDGQSYSVFYNTATDSTFTKLGDVLADGSNTYSGRSNSRIRVVSTSDSGPLADNVASIRFDFDGFENGGTAYREIDIHGAPVGVPEPSGLAMAMLAGSAGLLAVFIRRKSRA